MTQEIAVGGWVVFAVLIFFCIPLCWIGLLITEDKRKCREWLFSIEETDFRAFCPNAALLDHALAGTAKVGGRHRAGGT